MSKTHWELSLPQLKILAVLTGANKRLTIADIMVNDRFPRSSIYKSLAELQALRLVSAEWVVSDAMKRPERAFRITSLGKKLVRDFLNDYVGLLQGDTLDYPSEIDTE